MNTTATTPRTPRIARALPALLALLVAAELAYAYWFATVPLPNASALMEPNARRPGGMGDGKIRRWQLWVRFTPYFIEGDDWDDSMMAYTVANLSHVEYLPQRLPIAGCGLLIAGGGLGLGLLALRGIKLGGTLRAVERWPLGFVLGMTLLGASTLILGRLGLLHAWPIRLGLAALALGGIGPEVLASWRSRSGGGDRPKVGSLVGLALIVGPFVALMALASMLPANEFDAVEYHLQGPKEWYHAGRIAFLPHNVYTSMPFGVEMLHLLGMVVRGDWWYGAMAGQFASMLFAPVGAAFVALMAARWGSPRAAWFAAVAYLTTPWVYRLTGYPYVEGPLIACHAALLWAIGLAWGRTNPRPLALWVAIGVIAGGAMACKYPGLISAVIPAGLVALADAIRRRSWALPLAFAAGLAVSIGPWLAKNVMDHGNPVYPLGHEVFGGSPWSPERQAKWTAAHGPRPISLPWLAADLTQVAGRNDWQSPLFAMLAPLAFLRPGSRRPALALAAFAAYVFATWWLLTHRLDRFWLPMLPALAVLAGLGADWTKRLGWSIVLGFVVAYGVFAGAVFDSTDLAAMSLWTEDYAELKEVVPEMASRPVAWLDAALSPGARVLLVGQAAVFHARHEVIYNTVFDDEIFETIARGRSSPQVRDELRRRGITHILVDWSEIARHRKPGGYGFTDFVQPEIFRDLVRDGVLDPVPIPDPRRAPGPGRDVYRVR